jgi:hypothetical protein
MTPVLDGDGRVSPIGVSGNPRVVEVAARANSIRSVPALSMTFDTNTTFRVTNGTDSYLFTGNEARLLSVGTNQLEFPLAETWFESVDSLAVLSTALPEFIITGEQRQPLDVPRLTIERVGDKVQLSWLDANRVYSLRAYDQLTPGVGKYVEVTNTNGMATALIAIGSEQSQFFRLLHARVFWE